MNSSAHNHAESEFDDLLGQLVDELAMTPPSQSAVALVQEVEPETPKAHIESTHALAADAAIAAGAVAAPAKPDNSIVKIVGILAGSLTAVAIAALVVFGSASAPEPGAQADEQAAAVAASEAEDARLADVAATQRAASEQAHARALLAAEAEREAEYARVEAAHLKAELDAAKKAPAKKTPRKRNPKPKPPKADPKPGTDFDAL